jgi:predicted RNase H-like nuclease (RuvC/YqgF family)
MMAYSWMDIASLALNLIFGGGIIITFITLKAQRKKADAEADEASASADSTELDNVNKAITIWREMAESLKTELQASRSNYDDVARQVEALRKEVQKLNNISQRILKKLDKITHENLDQMVEEIKQEIQKNNA